MPSRQELLSNVRAFTPQDIAEAVHSGVVTIDELENAGMSNLMGIRVKRILDTMPEPVAPATPASTATPAAETAPASTAAPAAETAPASTAAPAAETAQSYAPANNHVHLTSNYTAPTPPPMPKRQGPPPTPAQRMVDPDTYASPMQKQPVAPSTYTQDNTYQPPQDVVPYDEDDQPSGFTALFSFKGRIRRRDYWLTIIICNIILYVAMFLFAAMANSRSQGAAIVGLLLYLVICIILTWILLAQGCRRCHDRGNSGWFQLIPFYGWVLLFGGSDEGDNEYGPNPKDE